ncbi:MAG: non-canonical purine NTP pyrophosphatase [Gemmatimonadales bacterium]
MNRLVLATRSADKAREIKEILKAGGAGCEIVSLEEARVPWSSREDAIEAFDSFQSNARAKAEYFAKLTGLPTVADDSGLEVLSLLGKPGVKSKRFAPDAAELSGKALDEANNQELLRLLLGADAKRRRASYTCVAVLLRRPGGLPEIFTGQCWGRILEAPRGTGGFGYDPLFCFEALGKTFAELTPEEKNGVSHRGDAFRQVAESLKTKALG